MYCIFVFLSLSFPKRCKPLTICGNTLMLRILPIAVQGVVVYVVHVHYEI